MYVLNHSSKQILHQPGCTRPSFSKSQISGGEIHGALSSNRTFPLAVGHGMASLTDEPSCHHVAQLFRALHPRCGSWGRTWCHDGRCRLRLSNKGVRGHTNRLVIWWSQAYRWAISCIHTWCVAASHILFYFIWLAKGGLCQQTQRNGMLFEIWREISVGHCSLWDEHASLRSKQNDHYYDDEAPSSCFARQTWLCFKWKCKSWELMELLLLTSLDQTHSTMRVPMTGFPFTCDCP